MQIPDFIKDDSFVLISSKSRSNDLGEEAFSFFGQLFSSSLFRAFFYFIKKLMFYVVSIHCGENSRIFRDTADLTLPITEYFEIDN